MFLYTLLVFVCGMAMGFAVFFALALHYAIKSKKARASENTSA